MSPPSDFTLHGGALGAARRHFPTAPLPWIDLSTGINPHAYPIGEIPAEAVLRLPEAADLEALERLAATRYEVPLGTAVVAAPGTQSIIQQLPMVCAGGDVRVLGHTYGEYRTVYEGAAATVRAVPTLESLAGADVAIVVNPNNPDGRLTAPADLAIMARRVGTLVVDEAFADALAPSASLARRLPPSRVIVLRSFGKMYGLAGLRLGFALTCGRYGETLRQALGPWRVSGPAIAVASRALADDAWLARSTAQLATDGARLGFLLGSVGADPVGSTPLFRLVSHRAAPALFRALAARGILVRPFVEEPSWLRFGLPGCPAQWARLEAALLAFR